MTRRAPKTVGISVGVLAGVLGGAGPAEAQFMDRGTAIFARADQFEYRPTGAGKPLQWDASGWIGDSYTRLWIKTEGEWETVGGARQFDLRAEYSRLISAFWELQGGLRIEHHRRGDRTDTRASLDVGLLGLAPFWFELEPELFIAQDGQVSVRLTGEYDLLLTQRLILQPRFETYAAFSQNERFGIGAGLNYLEPGFRLRYEIRREWAPYAGLFWTHRLGPTARLAREDGGSTSDLAVVFGLRVWH